MEISTTKLHVRDMDRDERYLGSAHGVDIHYYEEDPSCYLVATHNDYAWIIWDGMRTSRIRERADFLNQEQWNDISSYCQLHAKLRS